MHTFEDAKLILDKFGISSSSVEIWGTGNPKREFLWSEDMADACVFLMENVNFKDLIYDNKEVKYTHINIGTGQEITIRELAETIKKCIGFEGKLVFNTQKPDGTMRKVTDVSKLHKLNWKHKMDVTEGIQELYKWYLNT